MLWQNLICTTSAQSKCNKVPTMSKLYQVLFSNKFSHFRNLAQRTTSRWITTVKIILHLIGSSSLLNLQKTTNFNQFHCFFSAPAHGGGEDSGSEYKSYKYQWTMSPLMSACIAVGSIVSQSDYKTFFEKSGFWFDKNNFLLYFTRY